MAIAQKNAAKKAPAAAKKAAAPAVKAAAKKAAAPMPAAKKAALLGAFTPPAAKKAVAAPAAPAAKEARASYHRAAADDSALVEIMKGMREACEQKKVQKLVNAIRAKGFAVSMGRAEKLIPLALAGAKAAAKNGGKSTGR
ncbi:MAG: hypothetical protein JWR14_5763 [Caballeronia sp.]|jgi:hypothetical protein|uniref:hypothetical protein n=1 Tax=Caballeronia sp. TaxID=1931223 RepID=UPI00261E3103|nr:hypothetical protein [Caballeronia sp.]MDB5835933.1 hypothetical protein [Caballeronia sp.]